MVIKKSNLKSQVRQYLADVGCGKEGRLQELTAALQQESDTDMQIEQADCDYDLDEREHVASDWTFTRAANARETVRTADVEQE